MNDRMKEFYMSLAIECSKMSRAKRLQVGAIIVKNNNVISFSWNGTPAGWDNNCEDEFGLDFSGNSTLVTKPEVIHAEMNCLGKLATMGGGGENYTMFITHAPCIQCSKGIYVSGIKNVYYKHIYKCDSGIIFLKKVGVEIEKV